MSINKGPIPKVLLPPMKPKPVHVSVPEEEYIPKHRTIVVKSNEQEPLPRTTRTEQPHERKRENNITGKTNRPQSSISGNAKTKETQNHKTFPCIKVEKYEEARSRADSRIEVVTEYLAPVIPQRSRTSYSLAPPSLMLERRSGKLIPSAFPQSNLSYSLSKSEGSIPDAICNSYSRHMGSTEDCHVQPLQRVVSKDRLSPDTSHLASDFQRPHSPRRSLSPLEGARSKYLKSFSMQNIS